MFEYILIQNFQGHKKLRVDFTPGITAITGPTDAGKSAIIRALCWVCMNQKPKGDFIHHGTKGATVKLGIDGHVVTRKQSIDGSLNEYHLDDQVYKAFGRGIPEPIERLLNTGPVCWQQQHDPPYWFGETAGEVSRQLNAIVNLGVIDTTLAAVSQATRLAGAKLEAAENHCTASKQEYDNLAWVPELEAAVTAIESLWEHYATTAENTTTITMLMAQAQAYHNTHQNATATALAGQAACQAGQTALKIRGAADALHELINNADKYTKAVWAVPPVDRMEEALTVYKTATTQAATLHRIIDEIQGKETILCQKQKTLVQAEKTVPKKCPTCGLYLQVTSTSKQSHP